MPDKPENHQKLGLGTVQFGLDYGVSNDGGKTTPEEVRKILDLAIAENIHAIDTARLYGDSEEVLGKFLPSPSPIDIVTKTICFRKDTIDDADVAAFKEAIDASLSSLHQDSIGGLLMHHADDLLCGDGHRLFDTMCDYKDGGKISKIGVSVYDGEQIDNILENFPIDLVQLPANIFDQRLIASGHLQKLKDKSVKIHVRSAFLQGIVFMQPDQLPEKLTGLKEPLSALIETANQNDITPMDAALAYLQNNPYVDCIICGVNNAEQFEKLCKTMKNLPNLPEEFYEPLAVDDPLLVNPANW